jgi:hypothetical protein
LRSQSIKVNGGYLEGVKLGLEPVMSWLEVGSLSAGEESGEVTSELEDVLLQAVEEAGLVEVALKPVPHSIPAAHQHCTYNTSLIRMDQQMKILLRILCGFRRPGPKHSKQCPQNVSLPYYLGSWELRIHSLDVFAFKARAMHPGYRNLRRISLLSKANDSKQDQNYALRTQICFPQLMILSTIKKHT